MYNRYIPQSDGSYRKDRVPERKPDNVRRPPEPSSVPPAPQLSPKAPTHHNSAMGFLKKLLPKEFDTGDLLIVLLLLLMAERCEEDQNTALLTLALYFFM